MRSTLPIILAASVFGIWFGCDGGNELGSGGGGFGGSSASEAGGSTSSLTGEGAFESTSHGGASSSSSSSTTGGMGGTGGNGGAQTGGGGASSPSAASSASASSSAASSASSSTGGGNAPHVASTAPGAGATGIAKNSTIAVVFDEAMKPASITTNTSGTSCTGSLQVSKDNFTTCVRMAAAPMASASDTTFTVTPAAALTSVGAYEIRVTTAAESSASTPLAQAFTTASPFTVRYFHTIAIDGTNDFTVNETFSTTSSSSGYTGYFAWDDTYFYAGMTGSDIGSNNPKEWLVLYFSGSPGTATGVQYNTQQPGLPFAAEFHVQWRADNDFTSALSYSSGSSSWVAAGWDFTGDVFRTGNYLEIRIPLANLGSPTSVSVVASMLNETDAVESTFAGVPSNAFASDGYDRDFGKYFQFNLLGSTYPALYPTSP